MALFHFDVRQIKRSAGQSAIACAAYRSGQKLYSDYYGEWSDYSRKGGVIDTEILLPDHAPPEYADRQTLWNAVEFAERGKKAQLAYSFELALQTEFSVEENMTLARQFLLEHFVSRGMIVDVCFHDPDREPANPHFHFMCPIRPLNPDGSWGQKQHREYLLDENGQRIKDEAGHDKFNAVPTTDWGDPETLEFWREKWAELCNAKFEEKGLPERIDHRSYERQGVHKIPTIHEGPAVRAMERKGIRTEKGDFNRWVCATNKMMGLVQEHLETLTDWIGVLQSELDAPRPKSLAEVMNAYYDQRNAGAYSQRAKINNLKEMSQMLIYLRENNIATLDDAQLMVQEYNTAFAGMQSDLKSKGERLKELRKLLAHADTVIQLRPIYGEYRNIRFDKQKAKFKAEHEPELKKYFAARRELEKAFPEGSFDRAVLEQELSQLQAEYDDTYAQFRELKSGSDQMWKLKRILEADARQNPSRYVAQGK